MEYGNHVHFSMKKIKQTFLHTFQIFQVLFPKVFPGKSLNVFLNGSFVQCAALKLFVTKMFSIP